MSFCFFCVFCGKQKVPVDIIDLKVFEPVEKLPNMELKAGGTSLSNMLNKSSSFEHDEFVHLWQGYQRGSRTLECPRSECGLDLLQGGLSQLPDGGNSSIRTIFSVDI